MKKSIKFFNVVAKWTCANCGMPIMGGTLCFRCKGYHEHQGK